MGAGEPATSEIARYAVGCPEIRRLMTIPGIDVTTAATLMATIGRIDRFASPRHLVGYLGLDPAAANPALGAVQHGHISKQGSATARRGGVEVWSPLELSAAATLGVCACFAARPAGLLVCGAAPSFAAHPSSVLREEIFGGSSSRP